MTCICGWHYLQTDDTSARASSQKVLVQSKLHVCSLSFHTMNFLSSVTSARHDHPGQKVLKYFSRFQQQNALRPVPEAGEVIDKVSSMVIVWPAKSQRMRLCQCLGLMIATSVSGLSAGILELPLPEGSERVLVSIADDRPDHRFALNPISRPSGLCRSAIKWCCQ